MKKLSLLFILAAFALNGTSQVTMFWRDVAANGDWAHSTNNPWYRQDDKWNARRVDIAIGEWNYTGTKQYAIAHIGNAVYTTMTVNGNLGGTKYHIHQILFENSTDRTINNSSEGYLSLGGGTGNPKIEAVTGTGTGTYTFNVPVTYEKKSELNPMGGNLIFTSNINNSGYDTEVWGSNTKSVSIASMSGSGGLIVKNTTTVKITGNCTFTGNTNVDYGTLELQADLSSAEIIVKSGAKLIINGNDVDVEKLTIISGGTVEVLPGKSLTVNGLLTNNGILTLKSDATGTASILAPGSSDISGTFKVQQYLSSSRNWYISSPVAGATVPTGYNYFGYQEPGNNASRAVSGETDYWKAYTATTSLEVGKGYIAQPTGATAIEFSGTTLNNADKSITLSRTVGKTKEGFNLVGNPYPAYINIDNLQSNSDILQTYWIRSKNGSYVFDTYNIPSNISTGLSGLKVSKYIPPMQAFWLRVASGKTSATVNLLNTNRAHQDDSDNKFRAPSAVTSLNKILRIEVSNGTNKDETVLYSNENALDSYDIYDSPKFSNTSGFVPEIYTTVGTEELVINGMQSVPLDTEIPLGFRTQENGQTFVIKSIEFTGFDPNIKVYIKDNQNLLNPETELTPGTSYSFTSNATDNTTRLSVIFKSAGSVTGLGNMNDNKGLSIFADNNKHIIINTDSDISKAYSLIIYNSVGQKLIERQVMNNAYTLDKALESGVYFVKIDIDGKQTTNKVVIR